MLPQFEKVIPKPLKKRYRDLFEDDSSIISSKLRNISTISTNEISYAHNNSGRTVVDSDNVASCPHQSHKMSAGCRSRKSVIKHSVSQRISVEISPKLMNNVTAEIRVDQTNDIEYSSPSPSSSSSSSSMSASSDDSSDNAKSSSRLKYLSKNSSIRPSATKFAGKLKVKWRRKYENLESGYESIEGTDSHNCSSTGCETNFRNSPTKRRNPKKKANFVDSNMEMISETGQSISSSAAPITRKLERSRKGLIYQKFMADSFPWNRKEKCSKSPETTQLKKRGRPKSVKSNSAKTRNYSQMIADGDLRLR